MANQATGQEAGAVYVSVMPSGQGFSKQMNGDLTGAFDSAQRSGTASFGRFFTRIAAAGAAILATLGIGRLVKNTVDLGVSYNTLEQSSRQAFTTILGSADAAAKLQADLREFAKTSPFPRQAFIEGSQQLLAFGFQAQQVIPTLDAIQDAVAAAGGSSEDLAQIVDVFASIRSQGKITTDDLNRLALSGINGFDILAQAAGVSGDEIRKRISSGAIDADTAIGQLTAGMTARFGGAADGLKTTWVGAVDRIKGAYRDLSSALVAPFVDPQGGGYAVEWANKFADLLRTIEGSAAFAKVTAGLENFGAKLDPIVTKGLALAGSLFEENGPAKFIAGLKEAAEGIPGLEAVLAIFSALQDLMPQLAPEIAKLIPTFVALVEAVLPILPPLVELVADLAPSLISLITALVPVLIPLVDLFILLLPAITYLIPVFTVLLDTISGSITLFTKLFAAMADGKSTIDELRDVFNSIPGPIKEIYKAIGTFAIGIINGVIDAINGISSALQGAVNGVTRALGIGNVLKIGKIPKLPSLQSFAKSFGLADSGTVLPRPGGTLILAAEAGRAESVVDRGKLNDLMDAAASGGGSDRPIYADGIGLLGWIREQAGQAAQFIFNTGLSELNSQYRGGRTA